MTEGESQEAEGSPAAVRAARAGCAGLETHARQQTGVPTKGQKGLNLICYVSFILSLFFKKTENVGIG